MVSLRKNCGLFGSLVVKLDHMMRVTFRPFGRRMSCLKGLRATKSATIKLPIWTSNHESTLLSKRSKRDLPELFKTCAEVAVVIAGVDDIWRDVERNWYVCAFWVLCRKTLRDASTETNFSFAAGRRDGSRDVEDRSRMPRPKNGEEWMTPVFEKWRRTGRLCAP